MSLLQFLRILFARRSIILAAMLSCFIVASVTAFLLPKTYTATSRILLGQPDPVSGDAVNDRGLAGFAKTQTELIKDYRTAGRVIDALGWARDPATIESYSESADPAQIDIRRWLAQSIIEGTEARLIGGTSIMEISYSAPTPQQAAQIADLVRDAFLEENLRFRRSGAAKIADWYNEQSGKALAQLRAAEKDRNDYAKANNIVLDESNTDLESMKLRALTSESATAALATTAPTVVQAGGVSKLDELDARIAQMSMTLGPNHPNMLALRRERDMIASAPAAVVTGGGSNVGAIESAYQRQKATVLGQSEKIDKLRQLQSEIDLRKDQYLKATARVADYRLQSNVDDTGIMPLADAVIPNTPSFPNVPLIMGGSIAVGFGLGVLLALLTELLARRVRSGDDLSYAAGAPTFAILGISRKPDSMTAKIIRFLERRKRRREAEIYG
jgi:polysaccharide biosynthesis transport protein